MIAYPIRVSEAPRWADNSLRYMDAKGRVLDHEPYQHLPTGTLIAAEAIADAINAAYEAGKASA